MSLILKACHIWETAKFVILTYVLAFVAGWLASEIRAGTISEPNRAAAVILMITVGTLLAVFATVGVRRWRAGKLSALEKLVMIVSIIMIVVCFLAGLKVKTRSSPRARTTALVVLPDSY